MPTCSGPHSSYIGTITPAQEVLQRPDVQARMRAVREALKDKPPMPLPGPNRVQLLALTGPAFAPETR